MRDGTALVTGGTGVTGRVVVQELAQAGVSYLAASRNPGEAANSVKLDFADESTWSAPFDAANITSVYLVAPYLPNTPEVLSRFVDFAVARTPEATEGKLRIVLLTEAESSPAAKKPVFMEAIHVYLDQQAAEGVLEYAALAATSFATNWSELEHINVTTIKEHGIVISGTGEGKVPWVAVEDIARTAYNLLVADDALNGTVVVLGPELLTFSDAAAIIGSAIGRKIEHQSLTKSAFVELLVNNHVPDFLAEWLGDYDEGIARGSQERLFADPVKRDGVKRVTGRDPISFREFVQKNKAAWQ